MDLFIYPMLAFFLAAQKRNNLLVNLLLSSKNIKIFYIVHVSYYLLVTNGDQSILLFRKHEFPKL